MTDYNKMKKLLLLDKLDGNRKGINGMLTIKDTFGDMLILGIPNNNVRKQYYGYLLEQYQEEKFVDLTQMKILFTGMALEGKWRDALETMAKAYEDVSSVRDGIESKFGCFTLSASFLKSMRSENWFSILLREAMSPR